MRGIVFTGSDAEVTDELTVRDPGRGEVLVAVQAAGVCHSDLSVIDGTIPWKPPSVLGHEGAGIVEAVGPGVTSVEPGDHVVVTTLANCGRCRACTTGHPTWCIRSLGNVSTPFEFAGEPASNFAATSVFVERTVVTEMQAIKISRDVPFTSACLIGCGVLTGVGAVLNRAQGPARRHRCGLRSRRGRPERDPGAQALEREPDHRGRHHRGQGAAREAVRCDRLRGRVDRRMLRKQIRSIVPHAPGSIPGALGPGGVTWAFDCVGHTSVLRSALDALDWGGTALAIGIPPRGSEVSVDVNALAYVDRTLMGCRYGSARPQHDVPLLVELYLEGRLMLDELVTETRPLDEFKAIVDAMHHGRLARGVLIVA